MGEKHCAPFLRKDSRLDVEGSLVSVFNSNFTNVQNLYLKAINNDSFQKTNESISEYDRDIYMMELLF